MFWAGARRTVDDRAVGGSFDALTAPHEKVAAIRGHGNLA